MSSELRVIGGGKKRGKIKFDYIFIAKNIQRKFKHASLCTHSDGVAKNGMGERK